VSVFANGSGGGATPRLVSRPGPPANLIVRGARLLDPRTGLDETRDLVVRDGEIAELAESGGARIEEAGPADDQVRRRSGT